MRRMGWSASMVVALANDVLWRATKNRAILRAMVTAGNATSRTVAQVMRRPLA